MTQPIDLALPVARGKRLDFSDFLDAERLLRLHPHWHVLEVAHDRDQVVAQLKDHATERPIELRLQLDFPAAGELRVACHNGPVAGFHFFPRNESLHVAFTARDGELSEAQEQDLTLWLQSIRQYLRLYIKTTPYTIFFRWLMNSALLKMNPSQRKICLMLYRFTLLEIFVILLIVIGYFTLGQS